MKFKSRKDKDEELIGGEPADDEYEELKGRVRIDKDSLDDECIRQPVLYQELNERHVLAVADRDSLKEKLAVVDATIAEQIRADHAKKGERTSESRIGDLVLLDPTHQSAYKRWALAVKKASMLQGLVAAADQRGRILKDLSQLFIAGYFDRTVSKQGARTVDAGKAAIGREGMRQARNNRNT